MAERERVELPKLQTSPWGVWVLVAIPASLILLCAILILVYRKSVFDVTMGLSLVVFCLLVGAGAAVTLAGIRSDRRLAALQLDFVSKVSHELKTPLTSIRLFAETLRMGRVADKAQVDRCLEVIQSETERLSLLIGRLLAWGAMEAGAYHVQTRRTPTEEVLKKAASAFQPQLLSRGASLEVTVDPGVSPVDVEPEAIVDALLNLLNNALKYGGESKAIVLGASMRPDGRVAIRVEDRGIGIEPRHQRLIFERFYRADERYSRAVDGVGLGLAIARHIVLAHGGNIELKSKVGEGSTFTIVLPPCLSEEQRVGAA